MPYSIPMSETYVILHNIRSTHNVGSIFRTSDGAGISKIYLTGYTPSPIDRFGRKRNDIAKVALGAEDTVLWESVENIEDIIVSLKKDEIDIVGVEQSSKSINYKDLKTDKPVAFIFGNEVDGLPKEILNLCDSIIEIPMRGKKESLNVSVSVGVILFSR